MMITTRRRIGSDSKSLAEIYRKYKKEVENPVDYNTFRTIIETTHLTIFEEICKRKNKIYLSRTIGSFRIRVSEIRRRILNGNLFNKHSKKIFFRNEHSDGLRFNIENDRPNIDSTFNSCFKFRAARTLNRTLAQKIFNKEVPTWT